MGRHFSSPAGEVGVAEMGVALYEEEVKSDVTVYSSFQYDFTIELVLKCSFSFLSLLISGI